MNDHEKKKAVVQELEELRLHAKRVENPPTDATGQNLRQAVTERKRAETLWESEEGERSRYNKTPVMMYSIDDEGKLVSVNDWWLQVMGYERSEVLGRKAPDFLTEASRRYALEIAIPRLRKTGAVKDVEHQFVKKNGEVIDVLLSAVAELDEQGRIDYSLAVLVDVTDRKRAEEALLRSEEKHRALLEINNAIISRLDRESLFEAIMQALEKVVHFDRASIVLPDPAKKDVVRAYAVAGISTPQQLSVGAEVNRQGNPLEYVLDQNRPLLRQDLEKGPLNPPEDRLLKMGIRSYVAVPLTVRGKPIGTLNLGSREPNRYSEEDIEFLLEIGTQVALAVENMLGFEEIAQLKTRLEQENIYLQEEIKLQHGFQEIVGQGPAMKKVLKAIETVAPTEASVLITGETGTGKELVAQAIHNLSPWKNKTLVKVNCIALPPGLIESELFGHEKGAFTGAISRKIGRFELAHGGTIFLDEIGDLPPELQAKLLRVLQEGEFERVGDSQTTKVDVRVVAATNRDIDEAIEEGRFRRDLYYRLNVFPIHVPSLRERTEDIPVLVGHFMMKYGLKLGKKPKTISQATIHALKAYPWPGNVRELENVVERAMIVSPGTQLELGEWPPKPATTSEAGGVATLAEHEREYISSVLELSGWRVSGEKGAAKLLGMKPSTLQGRMNKLRIVRESGVSAPPPAGGRHSVAKPARVIS